MESINSGGFDEDDGSISMFTDLSGYEIGKCPMNDENCEEESVQETDKDFKKENPSINPKKTDFRLYGYSLLVNTWIERMDELEAPTILHEISERININIIFNTISLF